MRDNNEVLEDVVKTLAEQHGKKVTELLLKTWEIGLSGVPDEYCMMALERSLTTGVFDYFPTSGKFRDLCRLVRSEGIKTQRKQNSEQEQIPLNRNGAKSAYSKLTGMMDEAPARIIPKLKIYEYHNLAGDLTSVVCSGHVDFELFRSEIKRFARGKHPNISHKYGIQVSKNTTDENGSIISNYMETEYISSYKKGSQAVTIGRF